MLLKKGFNSYMLYSEKNALKQKFFRSSMNWYVYVLLYNGAKQTTY
jgi:hypothetical protein